MPFVDFLACCPVDAIIIKSRASSRAAVRVRVRVPGRERLQAAREADGLGGIAHGLRQAHVVPEHADRERVASARVQHAHDTQIV
jgi:hypothetical protein